MQNNEIGLLPHTTYENQLKLNQTTMCKKEPKLQNPQKKWDVNLLDHEQTNVSDIIEKLDLLPQAGVNVDFV